MEYVVLFEYVIDIALCRINILSMLNDGHELSTILNNRGQVNCTSFADPAKET